MTHFENTTGYEMVGQFHKLFGHPCNTKVDLDFYIMNKKQVDLRISLIEEEVKELIDACKQKNMVEAVDALADTLYVLYGACHVFSFNFDKDISIMLDNIKYKRYYGEVINLNMTKTVPVDPFKLESTISDMKIYVGNLMGKVALLKSLINKLYENLYIDDLICYSIIQSVRKTIFDIEIDIRYIAVQYFKVDIQKCLEEVHRSNMTKLCLSEEEAKNTVEKYKNTDQRYDSPEYKLSDDGIHWAVYNQSTGKILKSIKYEDPQLKQFCE
jgi:predicted HAD superfamily Cof-like phosphohydrolase